jgi:hypothetical protein
MTIWDCLAWVAVWMTPANGSPLIGVGVNSDAALFATVVK